MKKKKVKETPFYRSTLKTRILLNKKENPKLKIEKKRKETSQRIRE